MIVHWVAGVRRETDLDSPSVSGSSDPACPLGLRSLACGGSPDKNRPIELNLSACGLLVGSGEPSLLVGSTSKGFV